MTSSLSLRRTVVVLGALVFSSCMGGLPDTYPTGTLKLITLDGSTVQPVTGVRVELYSDHDSTGLSVNTDGTFNFAKGSPGNYWVGAWKTNYTYDGSSVGYGGDDYPIAPVTLRLYEIPTNVAVVDTARQDSNKLYLHATYKPRAGEALGFVYRDPNPDSSIRMLYRATYSATNQSWEYTRKGRQYYGKLVGAILFNNVCDSNVYDAYPLSAGPVSNLISVQ